MDRSRASPNSIDDFLTAAILVGRNHGPVLLFDWWADQRLALGDMAAVVAPVWSMADGSRRSLPTALWVRFFEMADYPKPDRTLTLYRGATPHFARRMPWTDDPNVAQWFADRFERHAGFGNFRPAYVYTVEAPPQAVLWNSVDPRVAEAGRTDEREIVVDLRFLPKIRRL